MKYTVDVLTPADEELVAGILEALAKRQAIRYAVAAAEGLISFVDFDDLPVSATTADGWVRRLQEAEASGTVSWEEAQARFGL